MSRFFGTVKGNRGQATRRGHASGGLLVQAKSYTGDINVLLHAVGEEDHARITATEHNSRTVGQVIYDGPIADLLTQSGHMTIVTSLTKGLLLEDTDAQLMP